jgi:Flp pilus assembly protein TadG
VDTLKPVPRRNDAGAELIELAIVLPILVLLLVGIVDFAFLFQRWEVVTNASREGARLASMASDDYTITDVQNRVQSYLSSGGLRATPTTAVDFATTDTVGAGPTTINTVTVTVTYPSNFIFLPGSINITSSSEMRSEGGS